MKRFGRFRQFLSLAILLCTVGVITTASAFTKTTNAPVDIPECNCFHSSGYAEYGVWVYRDDVMTCEAAECWIVFD